MGGKGSRAGLGYVVAEKAKARTPFPMETAPAQMRHLSHSAHRIRSINGLAGERLNTADVWYVIFWAGPISHAFG